MDNGHKNAIFSSAPAPEDDLNTENWARSLEISAPAGMPSPESFLRPSEPETTPSLENINMTPQETRENAPYEPTPPSESFSKGIDPLNPVPLGQVTPLYRQNDPTVTRVDYDPRNIRTTGDRLEKSTIEEVDRAIDRLDQTGDLNNFYEEIRGEGSMLEANLNNSFNRKLYDKGEAK